MHEDIYVRCNRCDALVAFKDAARCSFHETDTLCQFCWTDHVERVGNGMAVGQGHPCWANLPFLWT